MKLKQVFSTLIKAGVVAPALAFSASAMADTYEVTVTNVTTGMLFTPPFAITHKAGQLWTLGKPAIPELASIAEAGDTDPLMALLGGVKAVENMQKAADKVLAGQTMTVTIDGTPGNLLTVVFMMVPTNDGFSGLNAVTLPSEGSMTWYTNAYDAGSETNDESCTHVPGPQCGGEAKSPDDEGEGFVHPHPGVHGEGDLSRATYNWSDPVAVITVKHMQ